ncbi:hypothetical protein JW964_17245 [candidate division KSB1 bacterium]|nr:hypothetical protein [candidate division KSB1 bacterium]
MRFITLFILLSGLISFVFAQPKVSFTYQFEKGKVYKLGTESTTKMTQEMMGQTMPSDVISTTVIKIEGVEPASNGDFIAHASFDKMIVKVTNAQIDSTFDLQHLVGKRSQVTMQKNGKITNITTVDTIAQQAGFMQMLGMEPEMMFKRLLTRLPDAPLAVEESWRTAEPETVKTMGSEIVVSPELEYKYIGRENIAGHDCAKLTINGPMALAGKGSRMGAEFYIEGDGKTTGIIYFDDKQGLLIKADTVTDQQSNIAVTGAANMTITQTVSVQNKVEYIP